ncbi:MAG TPA: ABC transporter permease [Polyangiaceae bacterium]|jgi:ABC-2 type transport system permease protein|nr:ABC transporter permease [Polyangiaceae bacterium]
MRALTIARRELYAYLRSPLGSAIIAAGLLLDGILFYWQSGIEQKLLSAQVLQQFFYNSTAATMGAAVLLSMRLLAEERQSGTITLLNTAPVRDRDIVAGKFISAFGMVTLMNLLTFYMPLMLYIRGKVSVGHILVGYLGLILLGAAVTALGLFASSLARSQVVAVIIAAAILAPLLTLWIVARAVDPPLNTFLSGLALHHENFRPFMSGTLEFDRVVYYVMFTYFFLLAATKVLEARRWR